ncbi:transporter substrate-binding domain-containing protein [Pelomonas sp. KK5]|uniref:transporter substrate-binding domain-containing protein n=1 Tax=Pelomonas sp. KK5 TaxID=1855730 RepID=UPI00097CAD8E|nr:transporter substrate-binding domain-containing protein [Pelomonas sp. KK5]
MGGWLGALALATTLLLALDAPAVAGCSRPIAVPIAPSGRLAFVGADEQVLGVYPDLLRQLGSRIGCHFHITAMPRARLEMEFNAGRHADLLISATRTPERDRSGEFVPLFRQPLVIVTRNAGKAPVVPDNRAALVQGDWRMAVQRSFHFSPEYRSLVAELEAAGRVDPVNDLDAAARMLRAARVDFALMSPPQAQAIAGADLVFRRFEGLPLMEVGLYLSRTSLGGPERALLKEALGRAAREGLVRQAFLHHYPPQVVELNLPL